MVGRVFHRGRRRYNIRLDKSPWPVGTEGANLCNLEQFERERERERERKRERRKDASAQALQVHHMSERERELVPKERRKDASAQLCRCITCPHLAWGHGSIAPLLDSFITFWWISLPVSNGANIYRVKSCFPRKLKTDIVIRIQYLYIITFSKVSNNNKKWHGKSAGNDEKEGKRKRNQ